MEQDSTRLLKWSLQRAMLGNITGNIAAVTAGIVEHCVTVRIFFFEQPSDEDRECGECIVTEIVADLSDEYVVAIDCRTLNASQRRPTMAEMEMGDFWAFVRAEVMID
jgi:hypothetical protein